MKLYEYVGNLHMHTPYSDGEAYHAQIADAAIKANLDFIVVTDHNVLVNGVEGYYGDEQRGYVLLLTGEEVHDQARLPQVNHCLVYNAKREVAQCASDPQRLIDEVNQAGGMAFLAHPTDHSIDWIREWAIPWVDWQVQRYTGIELWNYMSHFKDYLSSPTAALRNVFRPLDAVVSPTEEVLALWDKMLLNGQHVVAIGNSDAHGTTFRAGPLKKVVFPYNFLFRCVNTHILTTQPLTGNIEDDREQIYRAVKEGRCFIGYEIPGSAKGFRFSADAYSGTVPMGGTVRMGAGVTLQVLSPIRAHIKLIHNGRVIAQKTDHETLTHTATETGAYRVEVWRDYRGKERCWILSNPIYVEGSIGLRPK